MDLSNAAEVATLLDTRLPVDRELAGFTLDLAALTFIDLCAWQTLARLLERLRSAGMSATIVPPEPGTAAQRLLEILPLPADSPALDAGASAADSD